MTDTACNQTVTSWSCDSVKPVFTSEHIQHKSQTGPNSAATLTAGSS